MDDEDVLRWRLEAILQIAGHDADLVPDGEAAISFLEQALRGAPEGSAERRQAEAALEFARPPER